MNVHSHLLCIHLGMNERAGNSHRFAPRSTQATSVPWIAANLGACWRWYLPRPRLRRSNQQNCDESESGVCRCDPGVFARGWRHARTWIVALLRIPSIALSLGRCYTATFSKKLPPLTQIKCWELAAGWAAPW